MELRLGLLSWSLSGIRNIVGKVANASVLFFKEFFVTSSNFGPILVPVRKVVKKRIFYGQADHKR